MYPRILLALFLTLALIYAIPEVTLIQPENGTTITADVDPYSVDLRWEAMDPGMPEDTLECNVFGSIDGGAEEQLNIDLILIDQTTTNEGSYSHEFPVGSHVDWKVQCQNSNTEVGDSEIWGFDVVDGGGEPAGSPDLTVSSLTADSTDVEVGNSVQLDYSVDNIGDGDSESYYVGLYEDDVLKNIQNADPLPAGDSYPYQFTWTCENAGTYTLKIVADYDDSIAESDEGNNENNLTINCVEPIDLVPVPHINAPDFVEVGESYTVRYGVSETNGKPVSNSFDIELSDQDGIVETQTINELASNEQKLYEYSGTCDTVGTRTYTITVDTGNTITETVEDNNEEDTTVNCTDSQPPSINLHAPEGDIKKYTHSPVNLSFTVYDNSGEDSICTVHVQTPDGSEIRPCSNINVNGNYNCSFNGLQHGTHSWWVDCSDPSGNTAISSQQNFKILLADGYIDSITNTVCHKYDTCIIPIVLKNNYDEGVEFLPNILNLNLDGNNAQYNIPQLCPDECSYTIEHSWTCNSKGNYTISLSLDPSDTQWESNEINNVYSTNVTCMDYPPNINLIEPTGDIQSYLPITLVEFRFNISDEDNLDCTSTLNGNVEWSGSNLPCGEYSFSEALTWDTYTWTVECTDIEGQTTTQTKTFRVYIPSESGKERFKVEMDFNCDKGLTVTVLNAKTDEPVENAKVKLITSRKSWNRRTNSEGIAKFKKYRGGHYRLIIKKTGYKKYIDFGRYPRCRHIEIEPPKPIITPRPEPKPIEVPVQENNKTQPVTTSIKEVKETHKTPTRWNPLPKQLIGMKIQTKSQNSLYSSFFKSGSDEVRLLLEVNGKPMVDMPVKLYYPDGKEVELRTNAEGYISIPNPIPGTYYASVNTQRYKGELEFKIEDNKFNFGILTIPMIFAAIVGGGLIILFNKK